MSLPHQAVLQPHRLIMLFEMCALLNSWMKTVSSLSVYVLKSAQLWFPLHHWVFPRNLFVFQNVNFTHSLLPLLTVRKLCNESVIKLGTV